MARSQAGQRLRPAVFGGAAPQRNEHLLSQLVGLGRRTAEEAQIAPNPALMPLHQRRGQLQPSAGERGRGHTRCNARGAAYGVGSNPQIPPAATCTNGSSFHALLKT